MLADHPDLSADSIICGKHASPYRSRYVTEMLARERGELSDLEKQVRTVKGASVLAVRIDGLDRQQMRALADSLRNKLKSAVVVLASTEDSNIAIVSAVTKDLVTKVHAGKLAGVVAQAVGGKGGGRPDMAEGGGKDASALAAALEGVFRTVESQL